MGNDLIKLKIIVKHILKWEHSAFLIREVSYLYTNTVLDVSVILLVRYRNQFPFVQFKN